MGFVPGGRGHGGGDGFYLFIFCSGGGGFLVADGSDGTILGLGGQGPPCSPKFSIFFSMYMCVGVCVC